MAPRSNVLGGGGTFSDLAGSAVAAGATANSERTSTQRERSLMRFPHPTRQGRAYAAPDSRDYSAAWSRTVADASSLPASGPLGKETVTVHSEPAAAAPGTRTECE